MVEKWSNREVDHIMIGLWLRLDLNVPYGIDLLKTCFWILDSTMTNQLAKEPHSIKGCIMEPAFNEWPWPLRLKHSISPGIEICGRSTELLFLFHLQVKVWNTSSGFCFVTFTEHTSSVTAVTFTTSGFVIFSASLDGTVRAFDLHRYMSSLSLCLSELCFQVELKSKVLPWIVLINIWRFIENVLYKVWIGWAHFDLAQAQWYCHIIEELV